MPPEEVQRQSAENRAAALRKQKTDTQRHNFRLNAIAMKSTGVYACVAHDADLFYGVAKMLGDPAHRDMLRALGRDEQAERIPRTVLVEVPGPVDGDVDATLTTALGLRRHTYAKNLRGVWVYRGVGVVAVLEDLVGPLGGAVTPTNFKEGSGTAGDSELPAPCDPAAADPCVGATNVAPDDAVSVTRDVGEIPTPDVAAASAPSVADQIDPGTGETDTMTTAARTGPLADDAQDDGGTRATAHGTNTIASLGSETKPGVSEETVGRLRPDAGSRRYAGFPGSRRAGEPPAAAVIPDFMKRPDGGGTEW